MTVTKNLKWISYVAMTLSLIGIILNAYLSMWCWVIWTLANTIWIYYGYKTQQWSLVILWTVFIFANMFGIYKWAQL